MKSHQIQTLITLLTEESPWASLSLKQKLLHNFKHDLEIIGKQRGQVDVNKLLLGGKIWEQLLNYWEFKESRPGKGACDYQKLAKFLEQLASKLDDDNLKTEYFKLSAYFWEVAKGETPKALFQKAFSTKERTKNFLELDIHRQITLDDKVIDTLTDIRLFIVKSIIRLKKKIMRKSRSILSSLIPIQVLASLVILGILSYSILSKGSINRSILGLIIFSIILICEYIIVTYIIHNKNEKSKLQFNLSFNLLLLLFASLLLSPNIGSLEKEQAKLKPESTEVESRTVTKETSSEELLSTLQKNAIKKLDLTRDAVDNLKQDQDLIILVDQTIDDKNTEIVKEIKPILGFTDINFTDVIENEPGTETGQKKLVNLILSYQLRVKNSGNNYSNIIPNGIIGEQTKQALKNDIKKALKEKAERAAESLNPEQTTTSSPEADPEEPAFESQNAINVLGSRTKPAIESIITQIQDDNLVTNDDSGNQKVLKVINNVLDLPAEFNLMGVLSGAATHQQKQTLVEKIYTYQLNKNITADGIIDKNGNTQKALLKDVQEQLRQTNN